MARVAPRRGPGNILDVNFCQGFGADQDAGAHRDRKFPAAMSRGGKDLDQRTQGTGADAYPADRIKRGGHARMAGSRLISAGWLADKGQRWFHAAIRKRKPCGGSKKCGDRWHEPYARIGIFARYFDHKRSHRQSGNSRRKAPDDRSYTCHGVLLQQRAWHVTSEE